MLAAVGFGLSQDDKDLITKIAAGVGIPGDVRIIDVRTNVLDLDGINIVLCFGQRAHWTVETYVKGAKRKNFFMSSLPAISELYPVEKGGVEGMRRKAFNSLQEVKRKFYTSETQQLQNDTALITGIKTDTLPDLSLGMIQELVTKLRDLGRKDWTCIVANDKVVRITLEPQTEKPSGIDSDITVAELMLIRAAMDVFQVKEVRFVPSKPVASPERDQTS